MRNFTPLWRAGGSLLLFLAIAITSPALASENFVLQITGTVTSERNEPLPGVTVVVQGTSIGTFTDAEGRYTLEIPDENANGVLVFSFVGFLTQEIPIQSRTIIDAQLSEDTQML